MCIYCTFYMMFNYRAFDRGGVNRGGCVSMSTIDVDRLRQKVIQLHVYLQMNFI